MGHDRELRSPGPRVSAGEDPQARAFDGFVGTWDTKFAFIQEDGSRQYAHGQFIAGWVLDGRALQDLWIMTTPGQSGRWIGTTVRFFDPDRKRWRVTWVSPSARDVTMLEGGAEGDRIVLYANVPTGKLRWSFNDMTEHDFIWRGEKSSDGGKSWRLREEHHMHRMSRPS
jgi:hypothetical protein